MYQVFILAAGSSKRFGHDKLFEIINGKPIIWHSVNFFESLDIVNDIFIATNCNNRERIKNLITKEKFMKVQKVIIGGITRYESVRKLLCACQLKPSSFFVIHNAANPLVTEDELKRCFQAFKKGISGVAVGRKITSTLKRVGRTTETIPRENLWEVETPQVVRAKEFLEACRKFPSGDFTDDLAVLERAGFQTAVVSASPHNRKITTQEDFEILKFFTGDLPKNFSVGIGEDSHKFGSRRNLILGGVRISKLPALEANSDGDVMIHALCNAIASARGKGSLGTYATRLCKKGIRNSRIYLQKIFGDRRVFSVSFSLEGSKPKIDPLAPLLKKNLSRLLKIAPLKIGITATSGENLTPFGRGQALKCTAQVLLCEEK